MNILRSFLLIVSTLAIGIWQCAPAQISADERDALITLYESTNGEAWTDSSDWLEEGIECDWYGIRCLDNAVVAIALSGNGLDGELPEALTSLQSLRFLALRNNKITGGVPAWLGDLPALEAVDLGRNPLGGELPATALQSTSLQYLWLDLAELIGSLPEISAANSALRGLWLSGNEITSLPESIDKLEQLNYLWLRNNQLTGSLPVQLGQLQELIELDISFNPLGNPLPTSLGALPKLTYLNAGSSNVNGDLQQWFDEVVTHAEQQPFPALVALYLYGNELTGAVPPMLFDNQTLRVVMLDDNQLTGPLEEPKVEEQPPGHSPLLVTLRNNAGLNGAIPEALVYRILLNQLEIWFTGTALEFGDCYGLRRISSMQPPLQYQPGEPVQVSIFMRNLSMPGQPRVVDTIPEHWEVVDDPDCYCTTTDPVGIISAPAPENYNAVLRYEVTGPEPTLAEADTFEGELVPTDPSLKHKLICGHDHGWIETIFLDGFRAASP